MAEKNDEREQAVLARMKESHGALNRAQAEIAVDHQIENDKAKAPKEKKQPSPNP